VRGAGAPENLNKSCLFVVTILNRLTEYVIVLIEDYIGESYKIQKAQFFLSSFFFGGIGICT
jgi:hypothetical protein